MTFRTLEDFLDWLNRHPWPLPCDVCGGTGATDAPDAPGGLRCLVCKGIPHHEQVTADAAVRMGVLTGIIDENGTFIMEGVKPFQGECFVIQGLIVRNKGREGRGWVNIGTMVREGHRDMIYLNDEAVQITDPENVLEQNPEGGG